MRSDHKTKMIFIWQEPPNDLRVRELNINDLLLFFFE
jgi:hypothetical protein